VGKTAEEIGKTQAIPLLEQTLAESIGVPGPEHPGMLAARSNLASAYLDAGRLDEAIPLLEQTLADSIRVPDPEYPRTRVARTNLANVGGFDIDSVSPVKSLGRGNFT
jgi:hypothetical protein